MTHFIKSLAKACYLRLFFGITLLKAINVTAADREYLCGTKLLSEKRHQRIHIV